MKEKDDLLSELNSYYRTKMNVFSKYLQIVWHRFSLFGAFHLGLLSFYLTQYKKDDMSDMYSSIPKVGIFLALLWALIGYMDYMTIPKLKNKGEQIEDRIRDLLNLEKIKIENNSSQKVWKTIDSKVSQHLLLYLVPLIVLIVWIWIILQ